MSSVAQVVRRRRRREKRRIAAQRQRRTWTALMSAAITLLVIVPTLIALVGAAAMYVVAIGNLPTPQDTLSLDPIIGPTRLYDGSGQTLLFSVQDPLGSQRRWITLDSLPPIIPQATIRLEDPNFFSRPGFDPFQTITQLWTNILTGPVGPEPSLTGRLVRNVIAPEPEFPGVQDRSREIALVAEINRRYSPQQILEWHLNTDYYGSEAYGIEAAAEVYLGKHAADLTLDEVAMLAPIPLAPQYNPFDNEVAARGRQQDALRALLIAGDITQDQYQKAAAVNTPIQPSAGHLPQIAPDFAVYARRQAERILDAQGHDGARLVARGGLKITTTLDLDLYYQAECALRTQLGRLNGAVGDPASQAPNALDGSPCHSAEDLPPLDTQAGSTPPNQGTIVVMDPQTGEIKAIVGQAGSSAYQPGPTLLPFVYVQGFRTGQWTAARMVLDIPRPYPGASQGLIYQPANPDGSYHGPMNLRDALGAGLLPPAVDTANQIGLDPILGLSHILGVNSLGDGNYDLMLLQQGGRVSALDMTYAYSVFASLGNLRGVPVDSVGPGYRGRDPVAVLKIEDSSGNTLWQYDRQLAQSCATLEFCNNALQDVLGYLVNDILADQSTRWPIVGQNTPLDLAYPAAVVNGLTGDHADDWTVGYTPELVTTVHLSRSDSPAMSLDPYGLQGAAPVWHAIMQYVHDRDQMPGDSWTRPNGIVQLPVCQRSGLLPNGSCQVYNEIFLDGTQPTQPDSYWQTVQVNSQTRQLATANTPAQLRSQEIYFIPPPDAADWWRANNLPLPPTEYDTQSRPQLFSSTQILQPQDLAYVGGKVDVRGSMDATTMQSFQLAYGRGLNPDQWVQIGAQQTTFTRGASLGTWDTTGLDGLYVLRLTVVRTDNGVENATVQVTVDNTPPTITLSAQTPSGVTSQLFHWPGDNTVSLVADVQDNLAIDHVEFYKDGQFIGTDRDWPYGFDWTIPGVQTVDFSAVAFDRVGNQATADVTVQIVRAGS